MGWIRSKREAAIVLLSISVQTILAIFLGHYFDDRVFISTGYLVNSGLNPYQPHTLVGVFPNPLLNGIMPIIGYPPPWPIILGIIYHLSYNIVPNLFLYNLAIKIPVMIGNIALAYLVRNLLKKSDSGTKKAEFAWLFLLFNPFTLLTTVAWGQIRHNSRVLLHFISLLGEQRQD